jgi:hypothetical protein
VTERSLVVIEPHKVFEIIDKLTPSVRYAMKAFGLPGSLTASAQEECVCFKTLAGARRNRLARQPDDPN